MALKTYNLNTTDSATNRNECVITPGDGGEDISSSASQTYEIVVPVPESHPTAFVSWALANLAEITKSTSKVWLPNVVDGDLLSKYILENVTTGQTILDVVPTITKIEGSITTVSGHTVATDFVELPFSVATKQIKKYNNSGTLVIPNFIKVTIKFNPYGDTTSRLSYGDSYYFDLDPEIDSDQYTFVNALSSGTPNDAQSVQLTS